MSSTLRSFSFLILILASASISRDMSTARTLPAGPTRRARATARKPVPQPISATTIRLPIPSAFRALTGPKSLFLPGLSSSDLFSMGNLCTISRRPSDPCHAFPQSLPLAQLLKKHFPQDIASPDHFGIGDPVINVQAFPAGGDDLSLAQDGQMLGEVRLRKPQQFSQFFHSLLSAP